MYWHQKSGIVNLVLILRFIISIFGHLSQDYFLFHLLPGPWATNGIFDATLSRAHMLIPLCSYIFQYLGYPITIIQISLK